MVDDGSGGVPPPEISESSLGRAHLVSARQCSVCSSLSPASDTKCMPCVWVARIKAQLMDVERELLDHPSLPMPNSYHPHVRP